MAERGERERGGGHTADKSSGRRSTQHQINRQLFPTGARKSGNWPASAGPRSRTKCATLYAVWGGGATPAQALHMVCETHKRPNLPSRAAAMALAGIHQMGG
jgi:hypothetical protein